MAHISTVIDDPKSMPAMASIAYDVPGVSDEDGEIRRTAARLGELILGRCERSPDRTQALRCLRESLIWAAQAVNGSVSTTR